MLITTDYLFRSGTGRGKHEINAKIDLLFVVDYSGSVSDPHFKQGQQFLRYLVSNLEIGPSNVQVSLVLFGKDVHEIWCFNNYTTYDSLDNALEHNMVCQGCDRSSTNTAAALKYAREKSFTERCAARPDTKKFVVVMTDGKSTGNTGVLVDEATDLKDSVDAVIVIGVGKYDRIELDQIASHPSLVFVTVFEELRTIETSIVDQVETWTKKGMENNF